MQGRCSSALSDHRRAKIVDKIVQTFSRSLERDGHLLANDELDRLERELHELFRSAAPTLMPLSVRPASASSSTPSSVNVASGSNIQQANVDALLDRFKKSVKSVAQPTVAMIVKEMHDQLPEAEAPNATRRVEARSEIASDGRPPLRPPSASPPLLNPTLAMSPVSVIRSLKSQSPSSFSQQSLRSYDALLEKIGPVPESKRLRKMIRDTAEFRAVQEAIRAADEKEEQKKLAKKMASMKIKEDLDAQLLQKRQSTSSKIAAEIALRRALEEDAKAAELVKQQSVARQREKLENQKNLNAALLQEKWLRESKAKDEQRKECESSFQSVLEEKHTGEAEAARKKDMKAQLLARQMEELRLQEDTARKNRQSSLRDAKLLQLQNDEYFQTLEEVRSAARDRVHERVEMHESLSALQSKQVANLPDHDAKRKEWLDTKYEREFKELARRDAQRETVRERQLAAQRLNTRSALLNQMDAKQRVAASAIMEDMRFAATIKEGLVFHTQLEDAKKQQTLAEREEWLKLIDAQKKLRLYNETKDIETNVTHSSP